MKLRILTTIIVAVSLWTCAVAYGSWHFCLATVKNELLWQALNRQSMDHDDNVAKYHANKSRIGLDPSEAD